MKFTMHGDMDLSNRLRQLPDAVSTKVQLDALKAGAEPVRRRASDLAPRGEGPGPHLADHIVISTGRRTENGSPTVNVGPARRPADVFWGRFQEHGTAFHGAQPFMRPAFDNGALEALGIIGRKLWESIRKRLPGSFGSSTSTIGGRFE